MSKECPRCKILNRDSAKFCSRCGFNFAGKSSASDDTNKCPNCRLEVRESSKFCPHCGARIKSAGRLRMRQLEAVDGFIHKCTICKNDITKDLVVCPSCLRPYHYNHLINWLNDSNSDSRCPACRVKINILKDEDFT